MRNKEIVYQELKNGFWSSKFKSAKVLRELKNGNLLIVTEAGIQEVEPKQVLRTGRSADWFNRLASKAWADGGSFGIDYLPDTEGNIDGAVYKTLDPDYGAFCTYG